MSSTITYHDRLRRARLDAGLSQAQLAARAGLSTSTVSIVEQGRRDLTAPRLFAWARACGAALDWIAGEQPGQAPLDGSTVISVTYTGGLNSDGTQVFGA